MNRTPAGSLVALLLLIALASCGKSAGEGDAGATVDSGARPDAGPGADSGSAADANPDGGADAGAQPDAGGMADAGSRPDAGNTTDAGTAVDAGSRPDAGSTTDAGTAVDAGSRPDAGNTTDAGTTTDAGSRPDAGNTTDAGTTADAGSRPDAGNTTDAGKTTDAGSRPDAGTIADAGSRPDAGTTTDAGSGPIGCSGYDAGFPAAWNVGTAIPPGNPGSAFFQFNIDSNAAVHPISAYVYGRNGIPGSGDPNYGLYRIGGNRWSAYNWENNASNAGSDYNYQNDSFLGGGSTPGEAVRARVASASSRGAASIVTVPILGWCAADKNSTDVRGQPITSRFRQNVAAKPGAFSYPPNLTDSVVYQDEFVAWLEGRFPGAHADPQRDVLYSLDNEPDLWSETHSPIHPSHVTYSELISKSISYARAIKAVAPQSKVLGFVSYGYLGFKNLQNAPDANGRDFTDFFLSSMKSAQGNSCPRLVDVLDLHWYPEAKGNNIRVTADDASEAVALARIQAPRSLWDPSYRETSWVANDLNGPIQLIPRMKAKIATHYPGTALAFTEYYYGGGAHISGAIAQADVLGIFGREGVYAAALWYLGNTNHAFIHGAFRSFRDYDGQGSTFGNTSISAQTSDAALTSVYASLDAGNWDRMVVVAINKDTTARTAAIGVKHSVAFSRAEVYRLTSASPLPSRQPDLAPTQTNAFLYSMPARSVTTLVLRK